MREVIREPGFTNIDVVVAARMGREYAERQGYSERAMRDQEVIAEAAYEGIGRAGITREWPEHSPEYEEVLERLEQAVIAELREGK